MTPKDHRAPPCGGFSRPDILRVVLAVLLVTAGCAFPGPRPAVNEEASQTLLETELVRLLGYRDPESQHLAQVVLARTAELTRTYRVRGPALWHNMLVNTGLRERGLCCHWAQDLIASIRALQLQQYHAHWGVSRYGTWREHNSVVITAAGQAFKTGLVLDPWRHAGALYWTPVRDDVYAWRPHPGDDGFARIHCR